MDRKELIKQYNAAGEALNAAVKAMREAPDGSDLAPLEQGFRDAEAEFTRCRGNLERADVLDAAEASFTKRELPVDNPHQLGMDQREVQEYSFLRAIRAAMNKDWKGAELEREASEAIAQRVGKDPGGFYVPLDVRVQKRADMTTGDATYAGNLVGTELRGESFIDMLRNRLVVQQAGATLLTGLVGNIAIPRQTGGTTFYWVAANNNTAITAESYPTVDQVTMTPHVGGAYTDIGRSLILQASIDVENWVRRDLAMTCATGIDLAALSGSNANDQPCGIASTGSIGSVAGGTNGLAPTWAHIVELETDVAAANADVGTMAYIVNAKTRGKLKTTEKASNTAEFIWDSRAGDTPLNGYRAFVSNQVRSNLTKNSGSSLSELFFGNWADLIIGQWGGLDILVDPYTGGTAGTVRIIALQDIDIAVRHPESFSRMADAICG